MSTSSAQLDADLAQLHTDAGLMHAVIHGDGNSTVLTDNGPVRTVANAISSMTAFNLRGTWSTNTLYAMKDLFTDGVIAYVVCKQHTSTTISADLASGLIAVYQGVAAQSIDTFAAPADFTPGTTNQLTLSRSPGSPGNLEIFFDGVYQGPDQWTLLNNVVTFSSAIPVGISKVYARIGIMLSAQIPPNGSVIDDTVSPNAAINAAKIAYIAEINGAGVRSAQNKFGEQKSIQDFYHPEDGLSWVLAYNRAVAYANSRVIAGTTIFFPDGQYDLSAGGLDAITVAEVTLVGSSSSGACLILPSGQAAIQFGNGASGLGVGGGVRGFKLKYTDAPAAGSVVFRFEYVSRLSFDDLLIENVRTLAWIGASAARWASALYFSNVRGSFYNGGGFAAFEMRYGAGIWGVNVSTFVAGVLAPTHPDPMTTAANTNVFNCVTGNWDTLMFVNSSFERFDGGLVVVAGSGMVYQNLYFDQCIFDYHKSSVVVLNSLPGGVVSTVQMHNCWYACWEQEAIVVSSVGGYNDNHEFTGKVILAGKQAVNYAVGGAKTNRFDLDIGAVGRVGGIAAALNFAPGATGFHVTNCRGNEDNTAGGFAWRAPYGILISADCDNYVVSDNRLSGSTAGYNIVDNSSGSKSRRVSNNANANYAGVSQGMPLPASGGVFTNTKSFALDVHVYGGAVTGITIKGVGVPNMTAGSFRLDPGDTCAISYTFAPAFTQISVA